MKRSKFSISSILVSALGLVVILKVFVYVLEHFVLQVTGEDGLKVDESLLNIALFSIGALLILRIGFIIVKHKLVRSSQTYQSESKLTFNENTELFVCAECGKKVNEKVRQYCLERPQKFAGQVYCYDHQKTLST